MTTLAPLFVPEALREALSDEAWADAVDDAKRALVNARCLAGDLEASEAARLVERLEAVEASPEVIETAAMLVARAAFDLLGLPDLRLPARLGARYFAEELELAPADPARAPFAEIADALDAATAEARTWTAVLRDANRWQTRCTALTEALAFAGTALA